MEAQLRAAFDETNRDDVREALRRYMKEHRIGVPTLQARIIEFDRPRHREIPLSTLQRFIAGSHHTHDHHVELCHAFVSSLPYYGEDRAFGLLGNALSEFLGDRTHGREREALIARLGAEYAGLYETEYGNLRLTAVHRQPYLRAQQTSKLLAPPGEPASRALAARRRIHEGIVVLVPSGVYMMLKDTLTCQPRFAGLQRRIESTKSGEEEVLEGEVYQPGFFAGMASLRGPIRFVREPR